MRRTEILVRNKSAVLRAKLSERQVQVGVGARDSLEARLIEEAGFDFVWAGSLCISASCGLPDEGLISGPELIRRASEIDQAVDLPTVLDSDLGYFSNSQIRALVSRIERNGLAGICMEDKTGPKTNSLASDAKQDLCGAEEFAVKIRAAAEARTYTTVLIARVEAFIAGAGLQEALRRSYLYSEAGADCLAIHSRSPNDDEVSQFARAWNGRVPLMLIPTTYPIHESSIRDEGKVKMIVYANQLTRAAVKVQTELLADLRLGGIAAIDGDDLVSVERIFELQGLDARRTFRNKS
jgi:phosphoenolpyruvate phosphomutase